VAEQDLQGVAAKVERVLPGEFVLARVDLAGAAGGRAGEAAQFVVRACGLQAAAPVRQQARVQEAA
jgi:hypothetical protein